MNFLHDIRTPSLRHLHCFRARKMKRPNITISLNGIAKKNFRDARARQLILFGLIVCRARNLFCSESYLHFFFYSSFEKAVRSHRRIVATCRRKFSIWLRANFCSAVWIVFVFSICLLQFSVTTLRKLCKFCSYTGNRHKNSGSVISDALNKQIKLFWKRIS